MKIRIRKKISLEGADKTTKIVQNIENLPVLSET